MQNFHFKGKNPYMNLRLLLPPTCGAAVSWHGKRSCSPPIYRMKTKFSCGMMKKHVQMYVRIESASIDALSSRASSCSCARP